MMAAGRAYRNAGDLAKAEALYKELVKTEPQGEQRGDAQVELSRIQALQNKFH
jgi:hypothetical protein